MATGPLDASRPWETRDVVGMYRFLQRLWRNVVDEDTGACVVVDAPADDETRKLLHRTIDVVRTEMDELRFNTAIAKLIELNNAVTKLDATPARGRRTDGADAGAAGAAHRRGAVAQARPRRHDHLRRLPRRRPGAARRRHRRVPGPGQRQGPRPHSRSPPTPTSPTVEATALADPRVIEFLAGAEPKKVIVVPGRMVNIVV